MNSSEANRKAVDLDQWLESAVTDAAYGMHLNDIRICGYPDHWQEKAKKVYFEGGDWKGWLADEMISDESCVSDFLGDRLYESGKTEEERIQVAEALMTITYRCAVKEACSKFIKRATDRSKGG